MSYAETNNLTTSAINTAPVLAIRQLTEPYRYNSTGHNVSYNRAERQDVLAADKCLLNPAY